MDKQCLLGFSEASGMSATTTTLADGHMQLSQTTRPLTARREQETTALGADQEKQGLSHPRVL